QPQPTDALTALPIPVAGEALRPRPAKPRPAVGQALQQYQRAQIETASPTRLVILLYEGAIRFCSLALDAMQQRNLEAQNANLLKTQRILSELVSSLNRESGGEIAANLSRLYLFMLEQLVQANLYDRAAPVERVMMMLRELRDSWLEVDRQASLEPETG